MMHIGPDASPEALSTSIIIPALDEVEALPAALAGVAAQGEGGLEVILADGGSRDRTIGLFRDLTRDWPGTGCAVRVVTIGRAGRSSQMNAGARVASGDVLLFLHADTRLPPGAIRAIRLALAEPRVVGGGFRHRFEDPHLLLRLISACATARSRLFGIHYGDQAMFLRRSVFMALGGFAEIPLFEDLRLSRALRGRGGVRTLPLSVTTSARRLRHGGIGRTAARFAWLKLRYALGADPDRLRAGYPDVR
jgi:rSAM/selenodomain-associated transferase 2